jgi:hypothetical protein
MVRLTGGGLDHALVAYTGQLGYYNFAELPAGQSYVVTVKSRRFFFAEASRVLTLNDETTGFDFIAEPQP